MKPTAYPRQRGPRRRSSTSRRSSRRCAADALPARGSTSSTRSHFRQTTRSSSCTNVVGAPHSLGYTDELVARLRRVGLRGAVVGGCRADPGQRRQPRGSRKPVASPRSSTRFAPIGGDHDDGHAPQAAARLGAPSGGDASPARRARRRAARRRRPALPADRRTPSSFGASTRQCATSTGTPFPASSRASRSRRRDGASASSSTSATHGARSTSAGTARSPATRADAIEYRLRRARGGGMPVQPHRPLRPPPLAGDGRAPVPRPDSGRRDRGVVPRPDRPHSDRRRRVPALFRCFDRLEVELHGGWPSRARVRGRPVGDRGSPQLDRRELQDVLDADRPRPARPARRRAGAPPAPRDHTGRRPGGSPVGGAGAAVDRGADRVAHASGRPRARTGPCTRPTLRERELLACARARPSARRGASRPPGLARSACCGTGDCGSDRIAARGVPPSAPAACGRTPVTSQRPSPPDLPSNACS